MDQTPIKARAVFRGLSEARQRQILGALAAAGIAVSDFSAGAKFPALLFFSCCDASLGQFFLAPAGSGRSLAIGVDCRLSRGEICRLLAAGAQDVFCWDDLPDPARHVALRLGRLSEVDALLDCEFVRRSVIGCSPRWQPVLRRVVEAARFNDNPVLLLGPSGTGKELIARVIHHLSCRRDGEFTIVDCANLRPELSGSEFFGHERGAFTGAVSARDGAFSAAHRGVLFLDEVGELTPPLQAQLLRVAQEKHFKRIGGNAWFESDFRLVCATNRDLDRMLARGRFRPDLYFRIAGCIISLPALRERPEDILPLAEFFLSQALPDAPPRFDPVVEELLLLRDYPGNIRDLKQLIGRILVRYSGSGTITAGDLAETEMVPAETPQWRDDRFETSVRLALASGAGLKDIGRAAEDIAIRLAIQRESGDLGRAADRLGVTRRTIELRRPAPAKTGRSD